MHVLIKGMHCSACVKTISKAISKVHSVESVSVDLDSRSAFIIGSPNTNDIQSSIETAGYTVESISKKGPPKKVNITNYGKSDFYKLTPLFLVLFAISISSWLLSKNSYSIDNFMNYFMGIYFIVFGASKIIDLKNFPKSFATYDPIASNFRFYGWIYPFIELSLGTMFLVKFSTFTAIILTIILLSITTYGVIKVLLSGTEVECACLGTWMKLPMTKATFIENFIMLSMAGWMLPGFFNG